MAQKDFFINSIELVQVHGAANIPTVVHYRKGQKTAIGSDALSRIDERNELNEDFKVDLGNVNPAAATKLKKFDTFDGAARSALEITADFLSILLEDVTRWLGNRELQRGAALLVAEPLAMQEDLVSLEWLSNYRNALRRILSGKGFENIAFLPEPFAVYQYYRHGLKHPVVADRRKHNALVLDFGGGTFDVCLIETTKDGDISQSGRQARPIAASSNPVGGFYVNRSIAEDLVRKTLAPKNIGAKLGKAFDLYSRWRRDGEELTSFSPEFQNFIRQFHKLTYRVEDLKIALCRSVRDWSLDAPLAISVPISVPSDPFSPEAGTVNVQYSASEFRTLFIRKVWDERLKQLIGLTFKRGKEELSGAPVTVVLLSGGSANIKWITELLNRDFGSYLASAEILQLKDFQEVVSKGLAVECARRYYTERSEGDFSSITYNRLCLVLDPDGSGRAVKKYQAKTDGLPQPDAPGVLLPSASVLTQFSGRPMRWRVHLDSAPRQYLDYYFLRSSFNPDDITNLQNIEEQRVHTPKDCKFSRDLVLELTVNEDGTSMPNFIYRQGLADSQTVSRHGKSFFIDMTAGKGSPSSTAYLGLDFGTSNSSVSFVDEYSISTYERRAAEKSWNELSELASSLPFPLAAPLASYLCQTDPSKLIEAARDFVEAALTLAAYITYVEYRCLRPNNNTRIFKAFTKRSAGPLWKLLRDSLDQIRNMDSCCSCYQQLVERELFEELNSAVTRFAQHKHGKVSDAEFDSLRPVQILANISHAVFASSSFGTFQQVRKQRFDAEYEGIFRHAHGRPPFLAISPYVGRLAFGEDEPFVIFETGSALPLLPLIFWDRCTRHPDLETGHCYLLDSQERDGAYSFKAVAHPCTVIVGASGPYKALHKQLTGMAEKDGSFSHLDLGNILTGASL